MFLAGIPVSSDLVALLAERVKDPQLAAKLVRGVERDVIAVRFDDTERSVVLRALDVPPPGLEDVRNRLLAEEARRQRAEPAVENAA